jgi:hypothetical protein
MGPGEQAVVQNGSLFPGADHNLTECIKPSETKNETFNDVMKFPARQIALNDTYVVVANASAPAEMEVPVSVTFDLTQNCDLLKKFYSEFASGYGGTLDKDGHETEGWKQLIHRVVAQPLQDSLNGVAQNYPWQQIWNDEKVRHEFREAIDKALPNASKARTNGTEYFTNFQVTVLKPTPKNEGLKQAIEEAQRQVQLAQGKQAAGVAEAEAEKAKADAQIKASQAKIDAAAKAAIAQQAEIGGWGSVDEYLKHLAIERGINPWQPQLVPLPTK